MPTLEIVTKTASHLFECSDTDAAKRKAAELAAGFWAEVNPAHPNINQRTQEYIAPSTFERILIHDCSKAAIEAEWLAELEDIKPLAFSIRNPCTVVPPVPFNAVDTGAVARADVAARVLPRRP